MRLERSDRGFVQVNLDSCEGDGSSATRSTVGTSIGDRSSAYADGGNLILEEAQMHCLRQIIADLDGTLDPELLVEIPTDCPAQ